MRSFISSFRPLLAAALMILGIEGTIAVTLRPGFVERSNFLSWSFGKPENAANFIVYQKLNNLPIASADVVQVGDSSGFFGVRPDIVMPYLGGLRYLNLSCCASTGWDGYYDIARTALSEMKHSKALVLYLTMTDLPRPYWGTGIMRVHQAFGTFQSLFNTPSEALRPSVTDLVYSMDGMISPRQDGLAVLNTGYYASIGQNDGWMPETDQTKAGAARTKLFSDLCAVDPSEPYLPDPRLTFSSETYFWKFAQLAQSYRAKLIIALHPYPCREWNNQKLSMMHAAFSELKRRYSNASAFPEAVTEHWPSYMFVSENHLRVGYERPNSARLGRFLADALGIPPERRQPSPIDTSPPPLVDLSTPPVWSTTQLDNSWRSTEAKVDPQAPGQGTRIIETESFGFHSIETTATGLTPGPYIVSVHFKPIGERIIEVSAQSEAEGPKGSIYCDPKLKTGTRSGELFDGDMSYLGDDWMLCWGSIEASGTDMKITVNILPESFAPLYAGDGHSGLIVNEVDLHRGLRPATAETGPVGGERGTD